MYSESRQSTTPSSSLSTHRMHADPCSHDPCQAPGVPRDRLGTGTSSGLRPARSSSLVRWELAHRRFEVPSGALLKLAMTSTDAPGTAHRRRSSHHVPTQTPLRAWKQRPGPTASVTGRARRKRCPGSRGGSSNAGTSKDTACPTCPALLHGKGGLGPLEPAGNSSAARSTVTE